MVYLRLFNDYVDQITPYLAKNCVILQGNLSK